MDFTDAWSDTCSSVGLAARCGYPQLLEKLLKSGRPLNVSDNRGYCSIHEAAASTAEGSLACLKLLVSHDKSCVDWRTFDDQTALGLAIREAKSLEKVKLLLQANANPLLTCGFEGLPLVQAIECDDLEMVKEILKYYKDGDINIKDTTDTTVLHCAASKSNPEYISLVLDKNASLLSKNDNGMTAIAVAAYFNRYECLKLLLQRAKTEGVLRDVVNMPTEDGATPLFLAVQTGCVKSVDLLLEHEADPAVMADGFAFPMHVAIQKNSIEILDMLCCNSVVQAMREIFITQPMKFISPLILAVTWQSYDCQNYLLERNFQLNNAHQSIDLQFIYDERFNSDIPSFETAVCVAAHNNDISALTKLLNAGLEVTPSTEHNFHPICAAIVGGSKDSVELLLKHGSDIDYCSKGLPVCIYFAMKKSYHYFRYILGLGADSSLCFGGSTDWFSKELAKLNIDNQLKYLEFLFLNVGNCQQFSSFFSEFLGQLPVLTLKQLSRISVRKFLIDKMKSRNLPLTNFRQLLEHLKIPRHLQEFVLMTDVHLS